MFLLMIFFFFILKVIKIRHIDINLMGEIWHDYCRDYGWCIQVTHLPPVWDPHVYISVTCVYETPHHFVVTDRYNCVFSCTRSAFLLWKVIRRNNLIEKTVGKTFGCWSSEFIEIDWICRNIQWLGHIQWLWLWLDCHGNRHWSLGCRHSNSRSHNSQFGLVFNTVFKTCWQRHHRSYCTLFFSYLGKSDLK